MAGLRQSTQCNRGTSGRLIHSCLSTGQHSGSTVHDGGHAPAIVDPHLDTDFGSPGTCVSPLSLTSRLCLSMTVYALWSNITARHTQVLPTCHSSCVEKVSSFQIQFGPWSYMVQDLVHGHTTVKSEFIFKMLC